MPRVTYVLADGTERTLDVPAGTTVMHAAVQNNVRGIDGECGGCLSCATCHVYVEAPWCERLAPPSADELELLSGVAAERRTGSRLGCQIELSAPLDGLVVRVPERQS